MRVGFAENVLRSEIDSGRLDPNWSFLCLCAGESDERLMRTLGIKQVTFSNLDVESGSFLHETSDAAPSRRGSWVTADAHDLPFEDGSFDVAFVSDGLHHCRMPHRAVTEMFRVSRRGIIVLESRDSVVMRAAVRLGVTGEYEFNQRLLSTRAQGGVDFGPVPNFVFRWTERDVERVLRTYNPENDVELAYYHGLSLPPTLAGNRFVSTAARALMTVAPRQGNTFGVAAYRGALKSYLEHSASSNTPRLRRDVASAAVQRGLRPVRRSRSSVSADARGGHGAGGSTA